MVQENHHLYLTTVTGLLRDRIADRKHRRRRGEWHAGLIAEHGDASSRASARSTTSSPPTDGPRCWSTCTSSRTANAVEHRRRRQPRNRGHPQDSARRHRAEDVSTISRCWCAIPSHGVAESILIGLVLVGAVLLLSCATGASRWSPRGHPDRHAHRGGVACASFNMSFNLMTLGGIAACIGVVIDDAIVMVENIMVHLSQAQTPGEASRWRHHGADAGAHRLHADADRGVRAAGVPRAASPRSSSALWP